MENGRVRACIEKGGTAFMNAKMRRMDRHIPIGATPQTTRGLCE